MVRITRTLSLCTRVLLAILPFIPPSFSLHESEAGIVDWHKPLIGVPVSSQASLSPRFHTLSTRNGSLENTVVLTATHSNVIGALEPESGSLQWRYVFDRSDPIVMFDALEDLTLTLSGPGGAILRALDTRTGILIRETHLHAPVTGRLFDPPSLGCDMTLLPPTSEGVDSPEGDTPAQVHDAFVLTNGNTLRRVDSFAGTVKWTWVAPVEEGSLTVYSSIAFSPSAVYLIGLARGSASYTLSVVSISPETGEVILKYDIPSQIRNGLTDFLVLDDSSQPGIAWLEGPSLKYIALTPQLSEAAIAVRPMKFTSLQDIGLGGRGYFLGRAENGTARLLRAPGATRNLQLANAFAAGLKDFSDESGYQNNTAALFFSVPRPDGSIEVSKVAHAEDPSSGLISIDTFKHAEGERVKAEDEKRTVNVNWVEHGTVAHIAFASAGAENHILVTTSTGSLQLHTPYSSPRWAHEGSLAEIRVSTFAELPPPEKDGVPRSEEGFLARLARQIAEARDLPEYLMHYAQRFVSGAPPTSLPAQTSTSTSQAEKLARDPFGFRQIVIAATGRGKVYALDSSTGAILWSRRLDLGWAAEVGGHHRPNKIWVTKSGGEGGPEVVLVTVRVADNTLTDTVIFHFDALTGANIAKPNDSPNQLLKGVDIIQDEVVDAYIIPELKNMITLVDRQMQVYIYPDTSETQKAFSKHARQLHFALRARDRIAGHRVLPEPEITGRFTAFNSWLFRFPPNEHILTIHHPPKGPIASLGKVLGDRSTLYKYLNPGLSLIKTRSLGAPIEGENAGLATCGLYLMDNAKGTALWHVTVPTDAACEDVNVATAENWIVYTYWDGDVEGVGHAKGWRIVSMEVYEGSGVDDKTSSTDTSIYVNASSAFHIRELSFVLPYGVKALSMTGSKFGITSKELIIVTNRGQLVALPRRILDPRRPKGRKPTSQEAEEGLMQYDPLIPDDPRRIISHNYHINAAPHIITSPSLLESTALLFSYGSVDLFQTRVAPSGTFDVLSESFNKVQLVLTVLALAVGIIVVRPMVRRKRLRERWYVN